MKFSVITVCFNAEKHLAGCLQSVAEQSWRNLEHIVIDGASTDKTLALIQAFPHVSAVISEHDEGIYDAMNKGLKHVTGDFVLFLNADDRFYASDTLARVVEAISADPGGDVYYGNLEIRPVNGLPVIFCPPPPSEAAEFLVEGCLPHQSTLARPSVFEKTGPFDLRFRHHAEYDWFLKIIFDPDIDVRALDVVIGSFLEGGASSQLALGQPEAFRIQNASPLFAGAEWDRKRIEILQYAWLEARLAAQRPAVHGAAPVVQQVPPGIVKAFIRKIGKPIIRRIGKPIEQRVRRIRNHVLKK